MGALDTAEAALGLASKATGAAAQANALAVAATPLVGGGNQRPDVAAGQSAVFFDTDLDKPVFWSGTDWYDAAGTLYWWDSSTSADLQPLPSKDRYFSGASYSGFAALVSAGKATFTRASTKTYTDAAGAVSTLSNDVFPTGTAGLKLEASGTNAIIQSDDLTQTSNWIRTDITSVGANAGVGPDGAQTLDLVTEGSAGTAQIRSGSVTSSAGSTRAASLTLKRGNCDWIRVFLLNTTSGNGMEAWVNLLTGKLGRRRAIGTGIFIEAEIEAQANGCYRVVLVGAAATGDTNLSLGIHSAAGDGSSTRVAGATYYAGRAQNNAGYRANSYSPTTTATVTRAADVLTLAQPDNFYNVRAILADGSTQTFLGVQASGGAGILVPSLWTRAIHELQVLGAPIEVDDPELSDVVRMSATGFVKCRSGRLTKISVASGTGLTIALEDGADPSANRVLGTISSVSAGYTLDIPGMGLPFINGLHVVITGTGSIDFTVS